MVIFSREDTQLKVKIEVDDINLQMIIVFMNCKIEMNLTCVFILPRALNNQRLSKMRNILDTLVANPQYKAFNTISMRSSKTRIQIIILCW